MEDYGDIISDNSCNEELYYSDQIDSDIEAELYGLIHHDPQENSISLISKSDSDEINNTVLDNQSSSPENDSVLLKNRLSPNAESSASLKANSFLPDNNIKSNQKLKDSGKTVIQNCSPFVNNSLKNFFSSDTIVNDNLYFSFETPVKVQKTQSNKSQIGNSKNTTGDKPAKRKSDLVCEILGNIQLKKNIISSQLENRFSKQKKNNQNHYSKMTEENSFLEVVDSSDSDSDSSIIFLQPNQSKIETNIEKETVVLSSDAEDSDSSMEESFSLACQRKQTAIARENSINDKDPWQVNSEDRFRTKKQSSRYHENAVITCSNCQLKGHSAKFCSVPKAMKCFFCGSYHSGMNCKNKICTKCFRQGHDSRRCFIRRIDDCELCRMRGHSETNCPDIWRRYHLTTAKGTIMKGNPNSHSPLYCYNCGSKGHYGAECLENRTDRWSFPTWTTVVSYKNPIAALRREKERNFQERSQFDRTPVYRRRIEKERFSRVTPTNTPNIKKKKKKKSPKTPTSTNNEPTVRSKNTVQTEVYFPRTPKLTPSPLTKRMICERRKLRRAQKKEGRLIRRQERHQIGLQQRLGLQFPSTV